MPVSHSKSPFSCITSILEPLRHTCHPWLHQSSASRSRGLRSSTRADFVVIRTNLKFGSRAFSCIVLYCIVLYCIVLYCIVLYCIVLYCRIQDTLMLRNQFSL